jgi:hypothetical protein
MHYSGFLSSASSIDMVLDMPIDSVGIFMASKSGGSNNQTFAWSDANERLDFTAGFASRTDSGGDLLATAAGEHTETVSWSGGGNATAIAACWR